MPSRSNFWKFFIKSVDGGKCKICQQTVKTAGNTTNLRFHLIRSHPDNPDIADMFQKRNATPENEIEKAVSAAKKRKNTVI